MEDDEIWKVIKEPVDKFTDSIQDLKTNIDKLLRFYNEHTNQNSGIIDKSQTKSEDQPSSDKAKSDNQLSPISLAKLELAIVYAMNTCYRLCLVTHGQNPEEHAEIVKDFGRIKLFMKRAKEVEQSLPYYEDVNVNDSDDHDLVTFKSDTNSAKRPRVDKEAAKRLCMNNMTLLKANDWT